MVLGQYLGNIHGTVFLKWDDNETHKREELYGSEVKVWEGLSMQILKSLRINARAVLEILVASQGIKSSGVTGTDPQSLNNCTRRDPRWLILLATSLKLEWRKLRRNKGEHHKRIICSNSLCVTGYFLKTCF